MAGKLKPVKPEPGKSKPAAKSNLKRIVSQSLMSPVGIIQKMRNGSSRGKPKSDTEIRSHRCKALSPLSLPEDRSEFFRKFAERYYHLMKTDPENMTTIYNTTCFLLLALLEGMVDERICRFLDNLIPITNIKTHMQRFDDSISMAMQLHRDTAHILNYWQLGALRRYEFLKWQLISIRSAELFLVFQSDQNNAFLNYMNRIMDRAGRDSTQKTSDEPSFKHNSLKSPEVHVTMIMNKDSMNLPLDEALAVITNKKRQLESRVENFSLYLRCIKELISINETNMAKIHAYQFRWRPIKVSERVQGKDITLEAPQSEMHKVFLQCSKTQANQ